MLSARQTCRLRPNRQITPTRLAIVDAARSPFLRAQQGKAVLRANKKWPESQAINLLKRLWPEVENDSPSPDEVENVPLCDRAVTKEADKKARS